MKTRRNSKAAEIEKLPPTTSDSKNETKKQPKKTKSESKEKSLLIEKPISKDTKKLPKGETKAIDESPTTHAPKEKKKEPKKRKNKKENEVNDELATAAKVTKKSAKGDSKNNTSLLDESDMKNNIVMRLPPFVRAVVVNRPSKEIKSPYMADITVPGVTGSQLCHSPALGCSGLIIPGANVLVQPKASKTAKSKYSLDLVDLGSTIVGANPMFCNSMVKTALLNGWVHSLPQFAKAEIKPEHTIDESRFDFKCEKDGKTYLIEVKGVPNASAQDPPIVPSKSKKKKKGSVEDDGIENGNKEQNAGKSDGLISYFPDGYRKQANDPISPRAMKHIQHLEKIVQTDSNTVCALVFVIQRSDCVVFQPTKGDPLYRKAVYQASQSGVLILPHVVSWSEDGAATWRSQCLPMNLKDESDKY